MVRRLVVLAFITSLFFGPVWGVQAANTPTAASWVVGARPFVLTTSRFQDTSSLNELTTSIPSLILENLADVGIRVLSPEEILQRQLQDLYKRRTSLGNSLSAAIKERDQQLFLSGNEKTVKKKLKEKGGEIDKVQGELEELEQDIGNLRSLIKNMDYSDIRELREPITLWKGDPKLLLQPEKKQDEVVNGLLTGEITVSGSYLSVRVVLTIYPGEMKVLELQSAASLTDVSTVSQEIAQQLTPVLQNRPTVLVAFDINPPEAEKKAMVMVDGQVFQPRDFYDGKILLPMGSHRIVVEADGFYPKSFTGDFVGSESFMAKIELAPVDSRQVEIVSENFSQGNLYINGFPEGQLNQKVELPDGLVFGTVMPTPVPKTSEDAVPKDQNKENSIQLSQGDFEKGEPFYFVADIKPGTELLQLNVRLKRDTAEISSRIEKRRRVMYNSYSALLVSLIPSFVSYGMYVNMSNGWALGHESQETVKMWKNIYTGSMILSAGLGVNLAVQIGLFLGAADSVLPERAKSR